MKAALLAIQPVVVDAVVVDGDARRPPPRHAPSSPRAEVTVIHGLAVYGSVGPEELAAGLLGCWVDWCPGFAAALRYRAEAARLSCDSEVQCVTE